MFRLCPRSERVKLRVLRVKLAGCAIDSSHLDAGPEAPKIEPRLSLFIYNEIWIDCIEVIRRHRSKDKTPVHPLVVGTMRIQRHVGCQPDSRSVLAKERVGVIKVKLSFKVRDVGRQDNLRSEERRVGKECRSRW